MSKKGMTWVLPIVFVASLCPGILFSVHAEERSLRSQLLAHAGETYTGRQDPGFLAYDSALRNYMVEQIRKKFAVSLDPKNYSGFKLLEIEAVFKCKKSGESFDGLLKTFR